MPCRESRFWYTWNGRARKRGTGTRTWRRGCRFVRLRRARRRHQSGGRRTGRSGHTRNAKRQRRRTRSHGRLNRAAATEQWRTQGNRARLVRFLGCGFLCCGFLRCGFLLFRSNRSVGNRSAGHRSLGTGSYDRRHDWSDRACHRSDNLHARRGWCLRSFPFRSSFFRNFFFGSLIARRPGVFRVFVVLKFRLLTRRPHAHRPVARIITAKLVGCVVIDRTGVGHLFVDTEFVELLDDLPRLDFQLPRQLIDSDLTHIQAINLPACPPAPGT
jgi:hypothetical protein